MRSQFLVLTGLLLCGMAPAGAQEQPREQGERVRRPERLGPGGPGGPGGDWQRGMIERISEELQLDDGQLARLEELMAAQREQMDKMFQEMREARESGDETRMQEARSRFADGRGPGGMFGAVFDEFEKDLRPDQVEKLKELRESFGRRMRGGPEALRQEDFDRLAEELSLDETQRQQFDEIVAGYMENAAGREERMREMRPLFDEMREAREAGDEAKMAELRAKFEEMRDSGERGREDLLKHIEEILTPEQKQTFARARERFEGRGGRDRQDPRELVRAARRLELTESQEQQLDEIEKRVNEQRRDVDSRDREAVAKLFEATREDIKRMLTEEQAQEFQRMLDRGRDRRRGPN